MLLEGFRVVTKAFKEFSLDLRNVAAARSFRYVSGTFNL